ncbi:ABC transporter permease [Streptomyces sp. NPDC059680]|uniref:ABC transporter permease n=1 Tax=Streptomyces sp. NPDC059680 TaxID=3346904 RepID=UPI003684A17B
MAQDRRATTLTPGCAALRFARRVVEQHTARQLALIDQWIAEEEPLDDKQVEELGEAPGVAGVQPVATGSVLVQGAGRAPYPLVGTALTGPQSLVRPLRGTLPDGPGEVVLTRALADLPGMGVGSRITLVAQAGNGPDTSRSAPARTVTVKVSGGVQAPSAMGAAVLTTPANARSWLGPDGWQQALLRVMDRPAAEVAAAVQGELGTDFSVSTASEMRAEGSGSKRVTTVSTLLTIFLLVALLAGTFTVSTTYRVPLVRDQTRLALLRCVGARPGQVTRSMLLQAAGSGLIAGAVGTATAICCSFAITGIGSLPGPEISPPALSGCALVSVLAALAAAMPAARAAARVAPVAALSVASTRHVADLTGRTRALIGAPAWAARSSSSASPVSAALTVPRRRSAHSPPRSLCSAVSSRSALHCCAARHAPSTGPCGRRPGWTVFWRCAT